MAAITALGRSGMRVGVVGPLHPHLDVDRNVRLGERIGPLAIVVLVHAKAVDGVVVTVSVTDAHHPVEEGATVTRDAVAIAVATTAARCSEAECLILEHGRVPSCQTGRQRNSNTSGHSRSATEGCYDASLTCNKLVLVGERRHWMWVVRHHSWSAVDSPVAMVCGRIGERFP